MLIFFFQAEDGIRDDLVTGVQTCALPISARSRRNLPSLVRACANEPPPVRVGVREITSHFLRLSRSEERRVGKECRSRWSSYHSKKKENKEIIERDK